MIARDQLNDLNSKVPEGQRVDVAVFRCRVNPDQTARIHDTLVEAAAQRDDEKVRQMEAALRQRNDKPYGVLYTADGDYHPFWNELSNIRFTEFLIE